MDFVISYKNPTNPVIYHVYQNKIAEIQQQIDAKVKFKNLLEKTQPLLTSISIICADYREVAPEELPFLMDEIVQQDLQVRSLWLTVTPIATTGDEKAQNFALDVMTQTTKQRARASAAFSVVATTQWEEVQQQNSAPEPEMYREGVQIPSKGFLNERLLRI